MKEVSVIMPVKDTEVYLKACVDSMLGQDFEDWELIAVNDGSTDGSNELLESYAAKDERIRVLDNAGQGIIAALQTGYALASGRYVSRMDSDDICMKEKLSCMHTALEKAGYGHVATGQVKYFSQTGLGEGYQNYESWLNGLTVEGRNFEEIYKECVIPSPCWMLLRSDFEALGGFAADRYPEDYDLCFRFFAHGLKVLPCDQVLHQWRDYASRTSRTDDHYADNSFLALKVDYFLKLHRKSERTLVIWGAGKRGKRLARLLIERSINFDWVCNNPQKIGHNIYGKIMQSEQKVLESPTCQVLVTVAVPEAQVRIRAQLERIGLLRMKDFFELC